MAGMMGTTAFLSMWMNNTASTAIMLPVALAVVQELETHNEDSLRQETTTIQTVANINGTHLLKTDNSINL